MFEIAKKIIQKTTNKFGFDIIKLPEPDVILEKDEKFNRIYQRCKNYTMTSKHRIYALYKAVEYVVQANIPGDFVECGVWKGGSAMTIALTLLELNEPNRQIYLYDTFGGMAKPTSDDCRVIDKNVQALSMWQKGQKETHNEWCFASLPEVRENMLSTGYPKEKMTFIEGKVEDTIPQTIPSTISLLRLDTDWYESTKHELTHLLPLVALHGVLIIDDYGYWAGSKRAVDEYFTQRPMLLHRIDHSGRIGIKIYTDTI